MVAGLLDGDWLAKQEGVVQVKQHGIEVLTPQVARSLVALLDEHHCHLRWDAAHTLGTLFAKGARIFMAGDGGVSVRRV